MLVGSFIEEGKNVGSMGPKFKNSALSLALFAHVCSHVKNVPTNVN